MKGCSYDTVYQAVRDVLARYEYGALKLVNVVNIIKPREEKQNIGIEFANEVWYWIGKYGADATNLF